MTARRTPIPWIALLALTAGLALSANARGDDVGANEALAMDLFDRGVRKMRQGSCERSPVTDRVLCEAARDALKRAYDLYPEGLGALRNLAYVEAGLGLVASAARSFRELARRAPLDPNPARRLWAEFAHKEADALAARVPHVQIELSGQPPADMTLLLDGSALPEAAWRTPLDLDPGQHDVRAEAPGYAAYVDSFALTQAEHKRISVALAPERPEPQVKAPSAAPPEPERTATERSARTVITRLGPLLLIGSGTAALAVGLGLGYKALRERDDACGNARTCEPGGLATGKQAAHASTAITSLGVAAAASGLVWYFVRRQREGHAHAAAQLAPALVPHGALLQAAGSF